MTTPDDSAQPLFEEAEFNAFSGDGWQSPQPPFRLLSPFKQKAPMVFASPHSGRDYPPAFVAQSRLGVLKLRRSEDAFVDEVFADAPFHGAPLLCARFPRAYVDANREAFELDPEMFQGPLPDYVTTSSPRIAAGLGTIARIVTDGEDIYEAPLRFEDAERRIDGLYRPYHDALKALVNKTKEQFGVCFLVDCHSMPSNAGHSKGRAGLNADVVLGDCHGTACHGAITNIAEKAFKALGFTVARNKPYAGGFTTRHYGRPKEGVHVLQVEINRALYMDEKQVKRAEGLPALRQRIGRLIEALISIDPAILKAP